MYVDTWGIVPCTASSYHNLVVGFRYPPMFAHVYQVSLTSLVCYVQLRARTARHRQNNSRG